MKEGVSFLADSTIFPTASANSTVLIFCIAMDDTTIYISIVGNDFSVAEATTFTAGRTFRIGIDQSGGLPWDGLLAEHIAYGTRLVSADIRQNFMYLVDKWVT